MLEKAETTTTTTDLEPNESTINRRYEPIVGQLIDLAYESSQATERDIERSEFSLQHQSSQDIDEESFSLDPAINQSNHSISLEQPLEEEEEIEEEEESNKELEEQLVHEMSESASSSATQQFSDAPKSEENVKQEEGLSRICLRFNATEVGIYLCLFIFVYIYLIYNKFNGILLFILLLVY